NVYTFAASRMEAAPVRKLMEPGAALRWSARIDGSIGSNTVISVISGMGPANARKSANAVFAAISSLSSLSSLSGGATVSAAAMDSSGGSSGLALRVNSKVAPSGNDVVLIIGLAGSLTHSIGEGDLTLYRSALTPTGECCALSEKLNERITARLLGAGIAHNLVTGVSQARIAATLREKRDLAATGAGVVDMESYELASASVRAGLPVAVVRVISDNVDKPMPDFNSALNSSGEFSPLALAIACLRRPAATFSLMKSSRRALNTLGLALKAILSTDLTPGGGRV
ncbi:MAG TPA: hypothetical protein VLZ81_16890, partial [Blastocatellia bacterium]|nr:hypothetical protein [Blastocatellia bacterium]